MLLSHSTSSTVTNFTIHFCETTLLRIANDIQSSLDIGNEVALALLDFSSAFDTIRHDVMMQRFKNRFGICGNAHRWFETYLKHREQEVVIIEVRSSTHTPVTGVPQGSVEGPLMFIMYTTPLYDLIISHGVSGMLYADDTQLCVSFKPNEIQDYVHKIQCCITDIKKWANANILKLNDSKTEVIHITSRFRRRLELPLSMVKSIAIAPTDKVKNLGVMFDQNMIMDKFVSQKCKTASFALYKIGKIRQFLD